MYLYLYDSFLNTKRFNTTLAKIETRLTDLGIGGKIFRLSPLRNLDELIEDEIRQGAKTIVVVGDNKSLSQVINVTPAHALPIGFIPLGDDTTIAKTLGIDNHLKACDILAARKIEKIDLAQANTTYFISELAIEPGIMTIHCDAGFTVKPDKLSPVTICNLAKTRFKTFGRANFSPYDGLLELVVSEPPTSGMGRLLGNKGPAATVIPLTALEIKSRQSLSAVMEGDRVLKTPLKIRIHPEKLKLIVSKNRTF